MEKGQTVGQTAIGRPRAARPRRAPMVRRTNVTLQSLAGMPRSPAVARCDRDSRDDPVPPADQAFVGRIRSLQRT